MEAIQFQESASTEMRRSRRVASGAGAPPSGMGLIILYLGKFQLKCDAPMWAANLAPRPMWAAELSP